MSNEEEEDFKLLLFYSENASLTELKELFENKKFSQEKVDEAFRHCIKNCKKHNKEYAESIKLFLKIINDINFQNEKYNETTILMYAFDEGQEVPCDLILSCFNSEINLNIYDSNKETTIFHLIKSDKINDESQKEFLTQLLIKSFDFDFINNDNETITSILERKGKNEILTYIKEIIKNSIFNINTLTSKYNKNNRDDYDEILKELSKYYQQINTVKSENPSFYYNILLVEMKILLSVVGVSHYQKDIVVEKFGSDILKQNQLKLIHTLNKVNIQSKEIDYSPCLIINKFIMLYQLDKFQLFKDYKNIIENNENGKFYYDNKLLFFYLQTIYIDMLIEREKIKDAIEEIKKLENEIDTKKDIEKKLILPNDLEIDIKDDTILKNIIKLYKIFIMLFINEDNKKKKGFSESFTSSNIKQANELMKKIEIEINELTINSNFGLKNFFDFLQIRLLYLSSHFSMNKLNSKLEKFYSENTRRNEIINIYYYNTQGIINLKEGKYSLSSFYFLKCLNILNLESSIQLIKRNHYYPAIAFNLALSYFYQRNYENCIKILYFLLNYSNNNTKFFTNNKYIYYRLALSQLEVTLSKNKNINEIYNKYFDMRDIKNCFILNNINASSSFNLEKDDSSLIKQDLISNDIIDNFKKVLLLIGNKYDDKIYLNTLFNLIFCLLINENYSEAIFYLRNIKAETTKIQKYIINSYLLQCYIFTGNLKSAQKISEILITEKDLDNFNDKFYQKISNKIIPFANFKVSVYINMIKMCILNGKKEEIDGYLIHLLGYCNLDISYNNQGGINSVEEIPPFIINVFVYYYLNINRRDLAINILKTKKIKQIFLPNSDKNKR